MTIFGEIFASLTTLLINLNPNKLFSDTEIKKIGVCAGSGSSVLAGCPADLWITGEMSHHEVLDAVHNGTCVILCEHSNTERGYLSVFAKKLSTMLDDKVEIFVSKTDEDPLKIV